MIFSLADLTRREHQLQGDTPTDHYTVSTQSLSKHF